MNTKTEEALFQTAMKKLPLCVVGATDNPVCFEDLASAAMLELDLHEEEQDGCISDKEAKEVRKYLSWLASKGVDIIR